MMHYAPVKVCFLLLILQPSCNTTRTALPPISFSGRIPSSSQPHIHFVSTIPFLLCLSCCCLTCFGCGSSSTPWLQSLLSLVPFCVWISHEFCDFCLLRLGLALNMKVIEKVSKGIHNGICCPNCIRCKITKRPKCGHQLGFPLLLGASLFRHRRACFKGN